MRLWHKDLIPLLPRQQLLGQWRECCAVAKSISEKGTPNHVLVNRVMEYPLIHFSSYTYRVRCEMKYRGYNADSVKFTKYITDYPLTGMGNAVLFDGWHNDRYLRQCLYNLQEKHDCGAIPDDEWEKITEKYPWIE